MPAPPAGPSPSLPLAARALALLERADARFRGQDDETDWVLRAWAQTLDALEDDYTGLIGSLDWVTKKFLIDQFREAENLSWDNPDDVIWMQSQDLEYHNVDRDNGLYYLLEAEGQTLRLVEDAEIADAMSTPPVGTRAYFRGRSLEKFGEHVKSINWDRVVFGVNGKHEAVDLKGMVDADVVRSCNEILDRADSLEQFIATLRETELQPVALA